MKKIRQQKQLLVNLRVFDQNKEEIKDLREDYFFWNIPQNLEELNPQEIVLNPQFTKMLLEEDLFDDKEFDTTLSLEEDSQQKVTVKVRLATFQSVSKKFKKLLVKLKNLQDYNLQLIVENQKLKQTQDQQNEGFTQKVKSLEEKASLEVKEAIQKSKLALEERFEKDIQEIKKYGNQRFFSDFLTHFITLERVIFSGLNQENPLLQNYVRGFEMVAYNIKNVLEQNGLSKIEPKIGEQFDANLQTSESFVEERDLEDGAIVEVKSHGYKLFERLLIPATVVVNRRPLS